MPEQYEKTTVVLCTCCEREIIYSTDPALNEVSRYRPQAEGADHYFCFKCDHLPNPGAPR